MGVHARTREAGGQVAASAASAGLERSGDVPVVAARRLPKVRWLDLRLLSGLVLVLASVGLGARVVAQAGHTVPVWVVGRDLAAGSVLQPADLRLARVRLGVAGAAYLSATDPSPAGSLVTRDLAAGEIVPAGSVRRQPGADQALVTVPVKPGHFPPTLRRGQRVDVYLSVPVEVAGQPAGAGTEASAGPRRVLAGVTVAAVEHDTGALAVAGRTAVILALPRAPDGAEGSGSGSDQVAALIAAFQTGEVDLVAVGTTGQGS